MSPPLREWLKYLTGSISASTKRVIYEYLYTCTDASRLLTLTLPTSLVLHSPWLCAVLESGTTAQQYLIHIT